MGPIKPKPGLFKRLGGWLKRLWTAVAPGPRAWRGAALGILLAALLFELTALYSALSAAGWFMFGLGALGLWIASALIGGAVLLLDRLLRGVPAFYKGALVSGLLLLVVALTSFSLGALALMLATLVLSSCLGAALWVLVRGGWRELTRAQRAVLGVGLALGLTFTLGGGYWLLSDGASAAPPMNAAAQNQAAISPLTLADPSLPGQYTVRTLLYGSGEDKRRPEYRQVSLVTEPVDGSALVESWVGLRTQHWGFGPEAMPRNGRVWYPDGAGPFPLVLIVHGNSTLENSDVGYAYLGELLASRGFILASVDENFLGLSPLLNTLFFNGLKEENDARGWLLLEHLKLWEAWNQTPGNPFYQKVDMQRIALMGHSRGGEAVAVAAAFNRLAHYPDDATVPFDYHFAIRAIVGIAPVDGQYFPTEIALPLENVDYLVLHGAHDMDVTSFVGRKLYTRLQFTDEQFHYKAALYIYGANHGQFNTVWGRKDGIEPGMRLFNLRQLMPPTDQRQIAKVYISAFLEGALRGERDYLPLFRDYRAAPGWLPDAIYLSQYADSNTHWVSTYDEDIDPATATLPGGAHTGESLTLWREQRVFTKAKGSGRMGELDTNAVFLGWDSRALPGTAAYALTLPESGLALNDHSVLVFSLADADEPPNPKTTDKKTAEETPAQEPIDLTLEVTDRQGATARLPLSHFSLLQPQIQGVLTKMAWMSQPLPQSEAIFQTFEFPLADFAQDNPAFDPAQLTVVRLVFDRTPAGVVILDDVGFREE